MLTIHRLLRTWQTQVDVYTTPSEFARQKYIAGGFPAEKIVVKPNFVCWSANTPGEERKYALFIGRVSREKNIFALLAAWEKLTGMPLKVVGSGPEVPLVHELLQTRQLSSVELLGQRSHEEVLALLKQARFLVVPTLAYETFGLVAVEAFACGTPVIAARGGAIAEIIEDGHTGLLFDSEQRGSLPEKIQWAVEHPEAMAEMGIRARRVYEQKYTAEVNYQLLLGIYKQAMSRAERASGE